MIQLTIFTNLRFNGPEYVPERDNARLGSQIMKIYNLMKDGQYRTLNSIHSLTGEPEASISAQLRHLRKERFGGHTVNRRYIENGLYEYQLLINKTLL